MNEVATQPEFKVIHANVYNPVHGLFIAKASDHAEVQTISCCNESCPLRAAGQCYMRGGLFGNACPYGRSQREEGPTKRAAKFHEWVSQKEKLHEGVPFLSIPPDKMAFIGDYVLLPYTHLAMCKSIPFLKHSSFLSSGVPFLPRQNWTVDTVLTMLQFRPQAMMGGEITSYQKEALPKFLVHLREVDPEMWTQLIAVRPELDKQASHIGRKALLSTLKTGIEWTESATQYPVNWHWDGTVLTTTSINAYSATWGRVGIGSVVIQATPKSDATVVVQSNEWVTRETVFAD